MSKYGVFSGLYFPVFGLNMEKSLRIQSEWRKIRTRKNSVFGHFSRSVYQIILDFGVWKMIKIRNNFLTNSCLFQQNKFCFLIWSMAFIICILLFTYSLTWINYPCNFRDILSIVDGSSPLFENASDKRRKRNLILLK